MDQDCIIDTRVIRVNEKKERNLDEHTQFKEQTTWKLSYDIMRPKGEAPSNTNVDASWEDHLAPMCKHFKYKSIIAILQETHKWNFF